MIKKLKLLAEQLNKSTSSLDKIKVLQQNKPLKDILTRIYDPDVLFNVTSKNCIKNHDVVAMSMRMDLDELLEALTERRLTGNAAIGACNAFANRLSEELLETFWNIIDKDLKCRVGVKMLEKAFSTEIKKFNVALANSYADVCEKVNVFDGQWFQSSKLDGLRCVSMTYDDNTVEFFSRSGKQFTSFNHLIPFIQAMNLKGYVLDGEMCYIEDDGTENFTKAQSIGAKKDFNGTNLGYRIFDCLTEEEFYSGTSKVILSERLKRVDIGLAKLESNMPTNPYKMSVKKLEQIKITSKQVFDDYLGLARSKGWEGLILRKDDIYKGKRSNDLLKVKDFKDAEYVVEKLGFGPIRFVENGKEFEEEMLSQVFIKHKGTVVGVGSGFTMDQRRQFKKNPKLIEGKMITVKYFQESQDKLGNYSLRFPTVIKIH